MGNTITEAQMEVWYESTDSGIEPDAVIPSGQVNEISYSERADEVLDEAEIEVDLPKNSEYDLSLGDRVRFSVTVIAPIKQYTNPPGYGEDYGEYFGGGESETSIGEYGGAYGGPYGSTAIEIDWTGRVRPSSRDRGEPGSVDAVISAEATDYVGDILSNRSITETYIDEDVGYIIRDIVSEKVTEVDASNVPDFGVTTDAFFQSRDCFDAIINLAAKADCILQTQGEELHIDPIDDLPYAFDLEPLDYTLPWQTRVGDDVENVVRVDSGVSRQLESANENQSDLVRVTDTNRFSTTLRARKSQIHSTAIYVDAVADNEELRLRVQADEGGAPIAPNDEDSDIVNASWPAGNLPDGGWKSFFFADHTLPERDVWLIIESSGTEGHDIGVDVNGDLSYRSYYPHPLNFEVAHQESINEYGVREVRIERDNLETIVATRDAARSELARRAFPGKTITFSADSGRAHGLSPGDVIGVNNPEEDAVGDFIVVEVDRTFSSATTGLDSKITAIWRKGVLAP